MCRLLSEFSKWPLLPWKPQKNTKNIFNDFLIFILVAILKILKTKNTTLSDDLFLCQVSKGSAVWSEFKFVCTLVTMATAVERDQPKSE
jgi:hypothetical protein